MLFKSLSGRGAYIAMQIIQWFLILILLLPGAAFGWQKVERPLGDRLKEVSLVVVASVAETESRKPSLITGVGDTWQVTLRVSQALKGKAPKLLRVTFTDASVQDYRSFRPDQERIWLLVPSMSPLEFYAPSSYDSILPVQELPNAQALLSH